MPRFKMRVYFEYPPEHAQLTLNNQVALGTIDGPETYYGDYYSSDDMYWPEGQDNTTLTVKGKTLGQLKSEGFSFVYPL